MPGIYGVYYKRSAAKKNHTNGLFSAMGQMLRHRIGYEQYVANLEHVSIGKISFSNDPGCVRSVWNEDHSILSFLDGAIFSFTDNYGTHEVEDHEDILVRLMAELRRIGTIDTKSLNGEFNLGIYDIKNRRLLIANDRWGFRELYYCQTEDILLFAPEMKALLLYSSIERKFDEQGLADFFNYGYILGDRTLIQSVSLLPPASVLMIDYTGTTLETRRFSYQPSLSSNDFSEHVDTAYTLLDRAVARRLRGRNRIAAYLSGGLDSRIIAAITAKHVRSVDTYTLGDRSGNEYAVAKRAASAMIPSCKNFLAATMPEHVVKYANWAVWASDGRLSHLSSISPFLGALAEPLINYDLLLGGFVGDLILGSSFTKKSDISNDLPFDKRMERMKFRVGVKHLRPFVASLFSAEFGEKLDFYSEKSVEEKFGRISNSINLFPFQEDIFVILTRCRKSYNVNRGLIGHAIIEEYYPFFDNDLFDFLYSLPPEVRLGHKLYTEIYKKYFPSLAEVPWLETGVSLYDEVSSLSNVKKNLMRNIRWYVKRATLGRVNLADKDQYAPANEWYRLNKSFRNFINDILLDDRTIARGYFRECGITSMLHKMRRGWDYMSLIGRLCTFELWCRLFLDGDEKSFSSGYDFEKDILND